jgi:hypothetical protein
MVASVWVVDPRRSRRCAANRLALLQARPDEHSLVGGPALRHCALDRLKA